jgi:hypothetical protein
MRSSSLSAWLLFRRRQQKWTRSATGQRVGKSAQAGAAVLTIISVKIYVSFLRSGLHFEGLRRFLLAVSAPAEVGRSSRTYVDFTHARPEGDDGIFRHGYRVLI